MPGFYVNRGADLLGEDLAAWLWNGAVGAESHLFLVPRELKNIQSTFKHSKRDRDGWLLDPGEDDLEEFSQRPLPRDAGPPPKRRPQPGTARPISIRHWTEEVPREYPTITSAAKAMGMSVQRVGAIASGQAFQVAGYHIEDATPKPAQFPPLKLRRGGR